MCNAPVTFGGGIGIVNGSLLSFCFGLNAPDCSHLFYKGSSTSVCSKFFGKSPCFFPGDTPFAAAVSTLRCWCCRVEARKIPRQLVAFVAARHQPLAVFSRCKCDDDKSAASMRKNARLLIARRIRTSSPLLHHLDDEDDEEEATPSARRSTQPLGVMQNSLLRCKGYGNATTNL